MQHNLLQIRKSTLEGKISFYTYPQTVPLRGQLNSNGVTDMANRVTAQYFDEGANRLHVVKFETHANDYRTVILTLHDKLVERGCKDVDINKLSACVY